jgi:hypothetical protein
MQTHVKVCTDMYSITTMTYSVTMTTITTITTRALWPAVSIKMADIDKWIDIAKECKYLPENDLKVLNSSY